MEIKHHYASVSKALEELKEKGFTVDFNLQEEAIKNNVEHFEILHIYRYEGDSNPGDESIVYGIQTKEGEKGVFVAGLSAKSDNQTSLLLYKRSTNRY
jgi:hypothetical protein